MVGLAGRTWRESSTAGTVTTSICRSSSNASRIDYTPQYGRCEVARPVGGAEDLDARRVRKEERPELENLVKFGEGLRRHSARSAEAGDVGRGESEATDRCDTPSARIQRDKRDGPRIATFLDLEDRRGSSGSSPAS